MFHQKNPHYFVKNDAWEELGVQVLFLLEFNKNHQQHNRAVGYLVKNFKWEHQSYLLWQKWLPQQIWVSRTLNVQILIPSPLKCTENFWICERLEFLHLLSKLLTERVEVTQSGLVKWLWGWFYYVLIFPLFVSWRRNSFNVLDWLTY